MKLLRKLSFDLLMKSRIRLKLVGNEIHLTEGLQLYITPHILQFNQIVTETGLAVDVE